MLRILSVFLFIFQNACIWGQNSDVIKERDFNGDGVDDRLECIRELGVSCTFTDGRTKKSLVWGNLTGKNAIKTIVTIPKALLLEQNEKIFQTMQKEILPDFENPIDPSLQWIIKASFSKQKITDNRFFDMVFSPQTQWKGEKIKTPSNYYVKMSRDSLYQLDEHLKNDFLNNTSTATYGFLAYYGNLHFQNKVQNQQDFEIATKDSIYVIYKTSHGVLAQRQNKFKWLFITDSDLTGGPQKLRWNSIEDVFLTDNYLLIKQSRVPDPEYQLFIVNIETGIVGKIRIDFDALLAQDIEFLDLSHEERFSIKEDTVRIGNEIKTISLPIKAMKISLDSYCRPN